MKHLEGLIGGIAVSETEYMGTTALKQKQLLTQVIYSNVNEIVKQGQYIFDTFWNKAIPAKQRIKEIEEGLKREFIETIRDPIEIQKLIFKVIKLANEEILITLPSSHTFLLLENVGLLELLNEVAERNDVKVRVLVNSYYDDHDKYHAAIKDSISKKLKEVGRITILYNKKSLQTNKLAMLIVDNELSLVVDIKDNTKDIFTEMTGLATYSNSDSIIQCNSSIFEALWIQTEFHQENKMT
jgi:two-component system sensor histidine kinase VicK